MSKPTAPDRRPDAVPGGGPEPRQIFLLIAASYGVDAALMAGFALAQAVPAWVPIAYLATGWLSCAALLAINHVHRPPASADPHRTVLQLCVATLVQLVFVVVAPRLAFLQLLLLFVIFGFASLRLPRRAALVAWLAVAATTAVALCAARGRTDLPLDNGGQRFLVVLTFCLTLGRCVLLGTLARGLRVALSRQHRELTRLLDALRQRDAELALHRRSLEHANSELRHQATHDALTGLPNRVLVADRIAQLMARGGRVAAQFALLVIDLDRFKLVNDTLGHAAGDRLLCHVAERLRAAVRQADTVARTGGDEFLVVLADTADRAAVERVARQVRDGVAAVLEVDNTELRTTLSIGISLYPEHGASLDDLLSRADEAMYTAKQAGRNGYRFFDAGVRSFSRRHLQMESELCRALAAGELELHYQPKVDIDSGLITSVEALLRWRHPARGLVMPAEFIAPAEESGLIIPIGRWVLREACRQARAWQLAALPFLRVSVNLSPVQFRQPGLLDMVRQALAEFRLEPRYLEFEVTEATVMNHAEGAIGVLEELSRMGVVVSLDDFGTGYSSMSYLRRFPIDKLKIDRSFISELAANPDDKSIVQAIVSLAHGLRLKVVAEGVETQEQLDCLRQLGCDQYQGFLSSPAVPAAQVTDLLVALQSGSGGPADSELARTHSRLSRLR